VLHKSFLKAVALSFCCLLGLGCPKQAFAKIATPRAIKEKDIDYSDIPELDESFWNNA
jgi:hypothetical protein